MGVEVLPFGQLKVTDLKGNSVLVGLDDYGWKTYKLFRYTLSHQIIYEISKDERGGLHYSFNPHCFYSSFSINMPNLITATDNRVTFRM